MATPEPLQMKLALGESAPATARDGIERLRPRLDFGVFELLRLLVSELVTHAARRQARELDLQVELDQGGVRATARASDPHVDWRPDRHPCANGEWGMYMVNRLSDRWGRDGTAIWFEIADDASGS